MTTPISPVFVGDTLYARTKVLDARPSKSRPGDGVVTTHTQGYNQDGTVVLSFERVSLVPRRGHGPVSEAQSEGELR